MVQWLWGCRYLFEIVISFPLDICPEVDLLNHVVVLILIFWGTSILFSIVAAQVYIPMEAQHSLFSISLPILVTSCLFDDSHSKRVCFAFPWGLVMLNIFSRTCWPSEYLLWKNIYSGPLLILSSDGLGFYFILFFAIEAFCFANCF